MKIIQLNVVIILQMSTEVFSKSGRKMDPYPAMFQKAMWQNRYKYIMQLRPHNELDSCTMLNRLFLVPEVKKGEPA